MAEPSSFESRYYLGEASLLQRWWRDLRIIGSSARFVWLWFTLGGHVRKVLRTAEREGRVVYMEELFGAEDKN